MSTMARLTRLKADVAALTAPEMPDVDRFWYEDGPQAIRDFWDAIAVEWSEHPLFTADPDDDRALVAVFALHPMCEDIWHHVAILREFPEPVRFDDLRNRLIRDACQRVGAALYPNLPRYDWQRDGRAAQSLLGAGPFNEPHEWYGWLVPPEYPYLDAWATRTTDADTLALAGLSGLELALLNWGTR